MRKKGIAIGLAVFLCTCVFGCGRVQGVKTVADTSTARNWKEAYAIVFEQKIADSKKIMENENYQSPIAALVKDIDNNGIPELLIQWNENGESFSMYTYAEKQVWEVPAGVGDESGQLLSYEVVINNNKKDFYIITKGIPGGDSKNATVAWEYRLDDKVGFKEMDYFDTTPSGGDKGELKLDKSGKVSITKKDMVKFYETDEFASYIRKKCGIIL